MPDYAPWSMQLWLVFAGRAGPVRRSMCLEHSLALREATDGFYRGAGAVAVAGAGAPWRDHGQLVEIGSRPGGPFAPPPMRAIKLDASGAGYATTREALVRMAFLFLSS